MRFCENCGSRINDGNRFCENCGYAVNDYDETAASTESVGLDDADDGQQPETILRPIAMPAMPTPSASTTASPSKTAHDNRPFLIIGICAAVAVALIVAVAFGVPAVRHQSWYDIMNADHGQTTSGSGESSLSTNSSSSDNATPEQDASSSTTITPKSQFADYSWDELSRISAQISGATSDGEALAIAKRFNLTDASGRLSDTQTKDVRLTDGTSIPVRIAGFRQDVASDGTLAGITVIASTSLTTRSMNPSKYSNGGWQQSDMRSWLNDNLLGQLDEDVRAHIVTAQKPSNGVGMTDDSHNVTVSEDKIWLPSLTEIGGTIPRSDYEQGSEYMADIFNAEGTAKKGPQYQLFSDLGVNQSGPSGVLRSSNQYGWWLRSASPRRDGRFMTIRSDGTPGYGADADDNGNVMIGFCL